MYQVISTGFSAFFVFLNSMEWWWCRCNPKFTGENTWAKEDKKIAKGQERYVMLGLAFSDCRACTVTTTPWHIGVVHMLVCATTRMSAHRRRQVLF